LLTCKDFLRELSDYLDENLAGEARTQLEQHIAACPNCWVIADTTKKTIRVYKGTYPIPPEVEARLMQALERKTAAKEPK